MSATQSLRTVLFAAVLPGVVCVLVACGGADARRASHIARGERYLAAEQLEKARIEFANALQIAPNDPQARFLSGRVAEKLGNPRLAAGYYQSTIDVDPNHIPARVNLARLYLLSGLPDKAQELVRDALTRAPEDPELLAVRAAARWQLKDADGALADAQHAVQVAPLNESAVAVLAGLYRNLGQEPRAAELLQATLQRSPGSVDLREVLVRVYLASGSRAAAEAQLQQLIRMRPRDLTLRTQLAQCYIEDQRLEDAQRTLQAAMSELPRSDEAKLAYVDFIAAHRSAADGEARLRELIAREPRNFELQLGLGSLEQRAGSASDALATYRALIAADPQGAAGVTARDRSAALELAAGHTDAALQLLEAALKLNQRDIDALSMRGNTALARGDATAAIADLRAVLRERPADVAILRSLARAHLDNDEPALAEEALRQALTAKPGDVGASVDLADLLVHRGRSAEAIKLLTETVTGAPAAEGDAARIALVRAYRAAGDFGAARTAAAELKRRQPQLALAAYLAGEVARDQKRLDDAQREFQQALQLQPGAIEPLSALARLQFARGQQPAAIELVRAALARAPSSAATQELLGELYFAQHSYEEARARLEAAVQLTPGWGMPYRSLARVCDALHDSAGALRAYERGVRASHDPGLVFELAARYESQGRGEDAIRQYEALHQRNPHAELPANNLAMLLVTYRSDQASLDRARDLCAAFAHSDVSALLDTRGWVMFKRGEVPEALTALQQAATRAPDSRVILYHLGMAQLKAGQTDQARASLEAALAGGAAFSGTDEARVALAQLGGRAG